MSCCPPESSFGYLREQFEVPIKDIEDKTMCRLAKGYGPEISTLPLPKLGEGDAIPIAWIKVCSKKCQKYFCLPLYSTSENKLENGDVILWFALRDKLKTVGCLKLILKVDHIRVCWIENLQQDQYGHVGTGLMHFAYYASICTPNIGKIRLECLSEHFNFFTRWGASEIEYDPESAGYVEGYSPELVNFYLTLGAIVAKNTHRDYRSAVLPQQAVFKELFTSRVYPKKLL